MEDQRQRTPLNRDRDTMSASEIRLTYQLRLDGKVTRQWTELAVLSPPAAEPFEARPEESRNHARGDTHNPRVLHVIQAKELAV